MKDPNRPEIPRSRVKARSKRTLIFVLAAVVISAVFMFFFIMEKPSDIISIFNEYKYSPSSIQSPATSNGPQEALKAIESRRTAASLSPSRDQGIAPVAQDGSAQSVTEQQNKTLPHDQTDLRKGGMPLTAQSPDQKQGDPYKQLVDELNDFYTHLDQQPYMKDFHLKEPSKKHFSKLLQILIDNPPSVTRN